MDRALKILNPILYDAMLWFFMVGAVFAIVLGLGLVLRAAWVARLAARMNQMYSIQPAMQALDRSVKTEPAFYRRHRLWGSVLVVGALVFGAACILHLGDPKLVTAIAGAKPSILARWLIEASTWFLIVGNAVALAIGLTMFMRPSALKHVETWSNTWVSADQGLEVLDRESLATERWFARHPRLTGAFLIAGGAYILWRLLALTL